MFNRRPDFILQGTTMTFASGLKPSEYTFNIETLII